MRIKCRHGFFIFDDFKTNQLSKFVSLYGLSLVPWRDAYTFETIAPAPDFSIKGKTYLGATATKNFAGEPWDVFEQNTLVYNFSSDSVVQIATVTQRTDLKLVGYGYTASGLVLPGSLMKDGKRVTGYTAMLSSISSRWTYSEVTLV